jgi:HAD superfamily hydrolase (TIGR01509 family)
VSSSAANSDDAAPVDLVLFDLGGVLIDFGGVGAMRDLSGIDSDDELWRRWLSCPWVRSLERGHCTPVEFSVGMVQEWQLQLDPADFLSAFGRWLGGPMEGAEALVAEVKEHRSVGCLSNTNRVHWDGHFGRWPLLDALDYRFLSFELGMVKPDAEIFERVAELLPVPRERVVFLDDNLINIEAARSAGFQGDHVRGVLEARRVLEGRQILEVLEVLEGRKVSG